MTADLIIALAGVIVSALTAFIVSSIKIGVYKQKVDTLCTEMTETKADIKGLSTKLTETSTKLEERTRSYASTLTKVESPVSLSQAGKELLSKSGADKFVLDNQADLIEKIRAKTPLSAYDVQTHARQVVEEISDEPRFKPLKDFAFNEGLTLDPLFIVMGIYLRDIALPTLGYKLEEVDTSDPIKKKLDAIKN